MEYTRVEGSRWANAEHTIIDCFVDFTHLALDFVPFTASPDDSTEHGPKIFAECVAGKYGAVGEYVPPPQPEQPVQPTTTGAQTL